MENKTNVIMREDVCQYNMNIVLLPDDIFEIDGYSAANIDDTYLIDDYISRSMSDLKEGDSIELYINYGFKRALVSTLNVIFRKKITCNINIYNAKINQYVSFGKIKPQTGRHTWNENDEPVSFQMINRPYKRSLPESIRPVFSEKQIDEEHLFDADYLNRIAYEALQKYEGRRVYLYITGLTQALIACVNASRELGIQLIMKHYNPDDESYEHVQELYIA